MRCIALALALPVLIAVVDPAVAAFPRAADVDVAPAAARPGQRVAVHGRGFAPRARVTLAVGQRVVRRVRAGRRGAFRVSFRMPRGKPGLYFLRARSKGVLVRARLRRSRLRRAAVPTPIPPAPAPAPAPGPAPVAQPPSPPPTPPDRTTLVAAGDIACVPGAVETASACRHARTAQLVTALAPDAVAMLGDAQYQRGELANYFASYDPTWGAFKSITRPAAGNHEYLEDPNRATAAGHFGYFGAAAGEPDEGYYSYGLGSWRVFVLNTGALEWTRAAGGGAALPDDCFPVSCAPGSEQLRWLSAELAALPDDACVLAYWHHPRYSSGWGGVARPHPELSPVWRALQAEGAELALTGHAHNYERFAPMDADGNVDPSGLRQFVVGTGGRSLFVDPGPVEPGSERLETSAFGVLEVELQPGAYGFRFVAESGAVLDEGSGTCRDRL